MATQRTRIVNITRIVALIVCKGSVPRMLQILKSMDVRIRGFGPAGGSKHNQSSSEAHKSLTLPFQSFPDEFPVASERSSLGPSLGLEIRFQIRGYGRTTVLSGGFRNQVPKPWICRDHCIVRFPCYSPSFSKLLQHSCLFDCHDSLG